MKVHKNSDYRSDKPTVVALGCFDGVHVGHRTVISTAVDIAKKLSAKSAVWTFEFPPKNYFSSEPVPLLTTALEKQTLIERLSVDDLICVSPCPEIFSISPEDFFKKILIEQLSATHIVCGFNYTFGKKGTGNVSALKKLCEKANVGITVIEPVDTDGISVSSSQIRAALLDGNAALANKLLGYNFSLTAPIVGSQHLATKLGFPTANQLFTENKLVPKKGVYVSRIILGEAVKYGITNVGVRPTANDHTLCAETHIFDFDQCLYDKVITVEFLDFIREEKQFSSLDELTRQINDDIETAKKFINSIQ